MPCTPGRCRSFRSFKAFPALCTAFRIDLVLLRRNVGTQASQEDPSLSNPDYRVHCQAILQRGRPQTLGPRNSEIHVNDLRQTLEAHRLKNRASVVRRVRSGPDPIAKATTFPIKVSPPLASVADTVNTKESGIPAVQPIDIDADPRQRYAILKSEWGQRVQKLKDIQQLQIKGSRSLAQKLLREIEPLGDYAALGFQPHREHRIFWDLDEPQQPLPWLKQLDWSNGDALSRLHSEIKSFESFMSPTAQEKTSREGLVRDLRSAVEINMPGYSLEVYGSYSTGLYTPYSDIDLVLNSPHDQKDVNQRGPSPTRRSAIKRSRSDLVTLIRILSAAKIYSNIHILDARMPVLGGTSQANGLVFQITALQQTSAQDEYIKKYLAEYPSLRPLFFVLKNMLWIRGFTEPFTGGLGSYPLAMAIVAWLKISEPYDISISRQDDESLGEKLLGFLKFYTEFDFYSRGLSIEPPGTFMKRPPVGKPSKLEKEAIAEDPVLRGQSKICIIDRLQPYRLCLQDPADLFNDLGRRSYGIKHIQQTMRWTLLTLKQLMEEFEKNPSGFEKSGLLRNVIAGRYAAIRRQRAREGRASTTPLG